MNNIQNLLMYTNTQIAILPLIFKFALVILLALITKWSYIHYGHALSNRRIFANNFPILAATTFLVITVIKSSLALSLGLVGAISIVRFRAPIKEPEELAFLFLTIAIGLGIGADQVLATTVLVLLIIFIIVKWQSFFVKTRPGHNIYLNLELRKSSSAKSELNSINKILKEKTRIIDLRRLDVNDDMFCATYYLDCESDEILTSIIEKLRKEIPGISVTFVDQDREIRG